MRLRATILMTLAWTAPTAAQTDAVAVAHAFLSALMAGNTPVLRSQRTDDAVFIFGDVGGPMAGIEEAIAHRPEWKSCSIGPLTLSPEPVDTDLPNVPSIKSGEARLVEGTMSCRTGTGGFKTSAIKVVIARDKVAAFAF